MSKVSGGDGIPAELFQILKNDAVKVLYSLCQQMWKTQQWPQDWKRAVFISIPKKGNAKNAQTTTQLHSSSLDQEDPLEKEMATHSSILTWRILWMEEPGRLQSTGSQRVGHD